MIAGQNLSKEIYPVSIYTGSSDPTNQFALFSREYSAMNQAVIGMKTGEQKQVQIPNSSIAQLWSAETIAGSGVNISELNMGDVLPMAVSDKPAEMVTNTTITYLRAGEIVSKTNESIVVDSGYPAVDISIYSINANQLIPAQNFFRVSIDSLPWQCVKSVSLRRDAWVCRKQDPI